ncbi:MAG: phosphate acyltransferase, partial [Proteobacteria bacterium]|nr:phosphate acyltransferase [Pseudomonadota bacterium]
MSSRIRVAVDVMSGDAGLAVCVPGAVAALADAGDLELVLVGDPAAIAAELARVPSGARDAVTIQPASQV